MKIFLTYNDGFPRRYNEFRKNEAFWLSSINIIRPIPFRIIFEWFGQSKKKDSLIVKRMMKFLKRTNQVNECRDWINDYS